MPLLHPSLGFEQEAAQVDIPQESAARGHMLQHYRWHEQQQSARQRLQVTHAPQRAAARLAAAPPEQRHQQQGVHEQEQQIPEVHAMPGEVAGAGAGAGVLALEIVRYELEQRARELAVRQAFQVDLDDGDAENADLQRHEQAQHLVRDEIEEARRVVGEDAQEGEHPHPIQVIASRGRFAQRVQSLEARRGPCKDSGYVGEITSPSGHYCLKP
jgi:hypothetical protein